MLLLEVNSHRGRRKEPRRGRFCAIRSSGGSSGRIASTRTSAHYSGTHLKWAGREVRSGWTTIVWMSSEVLPVILMLPAAPAPSRRPLKELHCLRPGLLRLPPLLQPRRARTGSCRGSRDTPAESSSTTTRPKSSSTSTSTMGPILIPNPIRRRPQPSCWTTSRRKTKNRRSTRFWDTDPTFTTGTTLPRCSGTSTRKSTEGRPSTSWRRPNS
mmetsp:Transcript_25928/g.65365  ORF Transcript_25928/g.65365 Transcript_25928/m.65365 type:complete len:213 (+) Transcript_25928:227-865(+)